MFTASYCSSVSVTADILWRKPNLLLCISAAPAGQLFLSELPHTEAFIVSRYKFDKSDCSEKMLRRKVPSCTYR